MKIVVTALESGAEATVDQRFGRAAWFVAVDTDSGSIESINNDAGRNAAQGAGPQAVQAIAKMGADCLLTGDVGPKAFHALDLAGIDAYVGAQGTVMEAVRAFENNQLQRAAGMGRPGRQGRRQ